MASYTFQPALSALMRALYNGRLPPPMVIPGLKDRTELYKASGLWWSTHEPVWLSGKALGW